MRRKQPNAAIVALTLASALAMPIQEVVACRCVPPAPPLIELARSDAVFSGKVVELNQGGPWQPLMATMEIDDCWKGSIAGRVVVTTSSSSAACGVELQFGGEYLIYAHENAGVLSTHMCTRTRPLEFAAEDLAALGEPGCAVSTAPATWGRVKRLYVD